MADQRVPLPEYGGYAENDGEGQGHAPHPPHTPFEYEADHDSVVGQQEHNSPGAGNPQHHRHPSAQTERPVDLP